MSLSGLVCPVCRGTEWMPCPDWSTRFTCLGCRGDFWRQDGFMVSAAPEERPAGTDDARAAEALGPQETTESRWAQDNRAFCELFRKKPDAPA